MAQFVQLNTSFIFGAKTLRTLIMNQRGRVPDRMRESEGIADSPCG